MLAGASPVLSNLPDDSGFLCLLPLEFHFGKSGPAFVLTLGMSLLTRSVASVVKSLLKSFRLGESIKSSETYKIC